LAGKLLHKPGAKKIKISYKFKDKEQSPANNFKTKHNKSKNFN
jgi:hypothetical protein